MLEMCLLIDLGHSFMIDSERLELILMYTKLSYGFLYGLNVFFVKSKKISKKSSVFGLTSTVTDSLQKLLLFVSDFFNLKTREIVNNSQTVISINPYSSVLIIPFSFYKINDLFPAFLIQGYHHLK